MNLARVALAAVIAWLASLAVGYLVNAVLLTEIYQQHASVFRPEADMNAVMPLGFVSTLAGFFVFAYAYAKGYEGSSGIQEGLRYGVLIGLLLVSFGVTWNYIVFPISRRLTALWAIDTIVEMAIYGMIVGSVYKSAASRRAATV